MSIKPPKSASQRFPTCTSKKMSLTTSFVEYLFQGKPPLFFGKY